MDLLRVDPNTYLPDNLIEGYTSLIWTERLEDSGEFELATPEIEEVSNLLPPGSFVTLRDSAEVMIVDSQSVIRNPEGVAELKIFGSTYESLLKSRIMVALEYKKSWPTLMAYTGSELISLLLWNHMVNATGEDPTRPAQPQDPYGWIPNLVVTDSSTRSEVLEDWSLEEGEVYTHLRNFLGLSDLGVRSIRPTHTNGTVMSFNTSRTVNRGAVIRTATSDISQLRLDVFHGLDRTHHQTDRPAVIFHYASGHIDNPQYLVSNKDYRNVAVINTSLGSMTIVPNTIPPSDPNAAGLNRKLLWVDGGTLGNEQDQNEFLNAAIQTGYIALAKQAKVVMFDGAISLLAPYKYNVDYFLGDRVTLMGEFDFEETMIISEYIRTQDINGERGYPGLARRLEYDNARQRAKPRLSAK